MDYRFLGRSGLKVPVLSFGAGTVGGGGPLFGAWGNTDVEEAPALSAFAWKQESTSLIQLMSIPMARQSGFWAQVYYSLIGRDYEWDLMPFGADQGLGALVWSPLGWGRLTGKIRRGAPLPEGSRLHDTASYGPPVDDDYLYRVVDALEVVATEAGKTVPQVALNWLIQRPSVSSVIIGARTEQQLRQNLGAIGWTLSAEQIAKLDEASAVIAPYPHFPYRRQERFARINPPITV